MVSATVAVCAPSDDDSRQLPRGVGDNAGTGTAAAFCHQQEDAGRRAGGGSLASRPLVLARRLGQKDLGFGGMSVAAGVPILAIRIEGAHRRRFTRDGSRL